MTPTYGQVFFLFRALQKVEEILCRCYRAHPLSVGDPHGLGKLGGRVIRQTGVADLAGPDQIVECRKRLL